MKMRFMVTGATGQLGSDLVDALAGRVPPGGTRCSLLGPAGPRSVIDVETLALSHAQLGVEDRPSVLNAVEGFRPDVIVHAGAYTAVDACEADPDTAFKVNALGTRNIVEASQRYGAHLVYVSTDYVFDGTSTRPYREWDRPNPRSVYGASKLGGEMECPPGATVVRTSWVCGAGGNNMVKVALRLAAGEERLKFVDDQRGSPTFTADLAAAIVTLGAERLRGLFHVTNSGDTTWYGFVRAVLKCRGHDPERVEPISTESLTPPRPAPRPANSVLDNMALRLAGLPEMPPWEEGLDRLITTLSGEGARL